MYWNTTSLHFRRAITDATYYKAWNYVFMFYNIYSVTEEHKHMKTEEIELQSHRSVE